MFLTGGMSCSRRKDEKSAAHSFLVCYTLDGGLVHYTLPTATPHTHTHTVLCYVLTLTTTPHTTVLTSASCVGLRPCLLVPLLPTRLPVFLCFLVSLPCLSPVSIPFQLAHPTDLLIQVVSDVLVRAEDMIRACSSLARAEILLILVLLLHRVGPITVWTARAAAGTGEIGTRRGTSRVKQEGWRVIHSLSSLSRMRTCSMPTAPVVHAVTL
jgi:hypothetical protein